ncbi:hypothetical protein BIFBIF_02069 [Bifidobacterium bifidum ATCC 29521 = JCM 1255 = DSM 20456]|nr:hypothetical protein BIFBIF_02069 [Bifidobacterium bifidum ATCC 29521 = JCM 1255 = DSM 20456]
MVNRPVVGSAVSLVGCAAVSSSAQARGISPDSRRVPFSPPDQA